MFFITLSDKKQKKVEILILPKKFTYVSTENKEDFSLMRLGFKQTKNPTRNGQTQKFHNVLRKQLVSKKFLVDNLLF